MLAQTKTSPNTIIYVTDINIAKKFYIDTLGLKEVIESDNKLEFKTSNKTSFKVIQDPNHTPSRHTVLNFYVSNISDKVKIMLNAAIIFEKYMTMDEVEEYIYKIDGLKVAWFKDPSGNMLALMQD